MKIETTENNEKLIPQVEFTPKGNLSKDFLSTILRPPTYRRGHFEYPTSVDGRSGLHRDAIFLPAFFANNEHRESAVAVARDIVQWLDELRLDKVNGILAPDQPGVRELAERITLERGASLRLALLEWTDEGWFGDDITYGDVPRPDEKWIAFNCITHAGSCVGHKLPYHIEQRGAITIAAATFATGKKGAPEQIERLTGRPYYTSVELDITAVSPDECEACKTGGKAVAWTDLE